jgi:prolyl oligopeptidase
MVDFTFKPISDNYENSFTVVEVDGGDIYIKTNKDAPNYKLIKFSPSDGSFTDIIPEKENVLNDVDYVDGKFFLQYSIDATERVFIFDRNTILMNEIKLPAIGNVSGLKGRKNDMEIFYTFTSFTHPPSILAKTGH